MTLLFKKSISNHAKWKRNGVIVSE